MAARWLVPNSGSTGTTLHRNQDRGRWFRSPVTTIRPEARFVTLAVREPTAVLPDELREAAAGVRDWSTVAALAARHGVAAFVRDATIRGALTLPAYAAPALHLAELVALAVVMEIDGELGRLVETLRSKGVPTIVLKGPALARALYPRRVLRPYRDIDLTIQGHLLATAARTLQEQGYKEIAYAAEVARRAHASGCDTSSGFHRQFSSSDDRVLVDLHADPLQLGLRPRCEAGRWRRAEAIPGLPDALMLCPEDQLIQLSTHVHKHGFERLIWLKDLDMLLRARQQSLDWELVHAVAQAEGVVGSVWYSLRLSQALLATPVPEDALAELRPSAPLRMLYEQVWPIARITNLEGFMRRRAVQHHAAESWRGTLPSFVLMGRRVDRAWAALRAMRRRARGRRYEPAR